VILLIPYQFEIFTAITIILVGAILTVYLLALKKNGWIGKTSIETGLKYNILQSKPELKTQELAPMAVETKVAITKPLLKQTFQLLNHRKTRRFKEKIIKKQLISQKRSLKDATIILVTFGPFQRAQRLQMNATAALN
jgi:hypothetical protein